MRLKYLPQLAILSFIVSVKSIYSVLFPDNKFTGNEIPRTNINQKRLRNGSIQPAYALHVQVYLRKIKLPRYINIELKHKENFS